jgi:hypothetical protein
VASILGSHLDLSAVCNCKISCGPIPDRRTGRLSQNGPLAVPILTREVQLCLFAPQVNCTSSSKKNTSDWTILAKNPSQGKKFG